MQRAGLRSQDQRARRAPDEKRPTCSISKNRGARAAAAATVDSGTRMRPARPQRPQRSPADLQMPAESAEGGARVEVVPKWIACARLTAQHMIRSFEADLRPRHLLRRRST